MTSSLHIRRPRRAFIPIRLPLPVRLHSQRRVFICSQDGPTTDVATASSPERAKQVQTRLESTRSRVRQLHSRAIVRAGTVSVALGSQLLGEHRSVKVKRDVEALFAQLRRDFRALSKAVEELPANDEARQVVEQLEEVVEAVERRVRGGDGVAHEEIEEDLEGGVRVVEDTQWVNNGVAEGQESMVAAVRRRVVAQGNVLKKVGAGIEQKVAEYVKQDGTVDWNGLRMVVGRILDNAGMTWRRLNGMREEEDGDGVTGLAVRDEEKEFRLREEIGELEQKLIASSKDRETVLRREDQLGKLIRAKEIRLMDDAVSALRRTLAVRVLQLEMEKIFVGVAEEIDNSDSQSILDQRLLVFEFGELDERLATLDLFVVQQEPLLIDDDVLGELAADIQDLKSRLGLDEALYSSVTLSWAQLRQFWASSAKKSRQGAEFYYRGLKLFAGDLRFAFRLIRRTILGYTPSPREIRTLRRTGRDLITLVPFTIVLIAPLTPVGHVLIFSFLQRYWPEFFPSTFSERRQAVMKRHEEYRNSLREEVVEDGVETAGGEDGKRVFKGLRKALIRAGEPQEQSSKVVGKNGVNQTEIVEGEHPVALSDLAESARDIDKQAKKKRRAIAMDELHLAD